MGSFKRLPGLGLPRFETCNEIFRWPVREAVERLPTQLGSGSILLS